MTGPLGQDVQRAARGVSPQPLWQEWWWLGDPSPAVRPSEDPGQRDQDHGPTWKHWKLDGCVGIEIQAFLGLRPNCTMACHNHCHEIKHLIKAEMGLWTYTQGISNFFFPPQKTPSSRSGLTQNL